MGKRKSFRGEMLGEEIRRIISELITRELKDPVFDGMISISYVKAADDGSFATVYFSSLGADDEAVAAGFENAKGFIRNEIGRKLGIRRSPELRFKVDEAARYGRHIDEILDGLGITDDKNTGREVGFSELPGIIDSYNNYLIFTHINLDGDTLGASVAFAEAMREIGRGAWVVVGEELPRTLEMINAPFVINGDEAALRLAEWGDGDNEPGFLSIAMDFTDVDRLEGRETLFNSGTETLSIDHHSVSNPTCDYNYIEPGTAATSEIVYRLLRAAGLPVTEKIATAIYVGIVTDTGRFQYANTTADTHRLTAELFEAGADHALTYQNIYQSVKPGKLLVQSAMLNTLDIFADGRAAIAYVTNDVLARLEAGEDETDGMSEVLRGIIGVEVSVFLKERPDGKVKASMRSKEWFDVAALAAGFGGGGHTRAAGFTSELTIPELCLELKERISSALTG